MSSTVSPTIEKDLAIGRLGLLAGEGAFPIMVARAARSREVSVVAVGVEGLTSPDLEAEVDAMHWVRFGQFDSMIRVLQGEGITKLILAGRIKHNSIFQWTRIDARGRRLMARVATRKADSLLAAVTQEFANEHIEVLETFNAEDKAVVENVYLGLQSPASTQSPYCSLERSLWDFGRYVTRHLLDGSAQ